MIAPETLTELARTFKEREEKARTTLESMESLAGAAVASAVADTWKDAHDEIMKMEQRKTGTE